MLSKKSRIKLIRVGFVLLALFLLACPPQVKRFTPEKGVEGTEVTIQGKNFGATPADNTVKFGDVTATDVRLPQENTIIAKVPPGVKTGLVSVTTPEGTGVSEKNFVVVVPTKWTFMVYLDADNNLESAGIDDFLEMATVGSSNEVKIVVQMDRVSGHDNTYGNWTGTRRFLIHNGDTPNITPVQDLGEQNMGDPAVLEDFVEWAVTTYPAEYYALSIWNHGGGWRVLREKMIEEVRSARSRGEADWSVARAVAWDDTDNDKLYMKEVQNALEAAKPKIKDRSGTQVKLDIVGFDACLMGMVEVAYAMRNVANYVVGSEETEPFDGWPYDPVLSDLVSIPTFSPTDVAGLIVNKYGDAYTYTHGITQSAGDISKLSNLVNKINAFTDKANTEWSSLRDARNACIQYHPFGASFWGVDLRDFAQEVANRVTSNDIRNAAIALRDAVDDFVISERHSPDMDGSHGVAIYFPPTLTAFNNDPDHTGYEDANNFMQVDFVKRNRWDNWLQDFYANIP